MGRLMMMGALILPLRVLFREPSFCARLALIVTTCAMNFASAHDIPSSVRIDAFVRPAADVLDLVVRVPMAAMQDVDFPRRGAGYLDLANADPALRTAAALWISDNVDVYERERKLSPRLSAVRVSLPSDRSFDDYSRAIAQLAAPPLPPDTDLYWNQGYLDARFSYPIESDASRFAIEPRLERLGLRTLVVLRFLPPGGAERVFEFHGNAGLIQLDPRWDQAALRFVKAGFLHILDGLDHLLFIACLVVPFRRWRPLLVIITAFTLAHSITLIASAYGWAPDGSWFPPLVEAAIAASIVYMAIENVLGNSTAHAGRRWLVAFVFGLVHGFGISFALRETLQFAGSHLITSLLSFNVGVELGQLLVLMILIPVLNAVLGRLVNERVGIIVLSVFIAHTGWHWMIERGERLLLAPRPRIDAMSLAEGMRWGIAAILAAALLWGLNGRVRRWLRLGR